MIADNHVPDEIYEHIAPHFSAEELIDLTIAVITINGWNRLAISFRTEPGTDQPNELLRINRTFSSGLLYF